MWTEVHVRLKLTVMYLCYIFDFLKNGLNVYAFDVKTSELIQILMNDCRIVDGIFGFKISN
jgi:hypothetical protein